MAGEEKLETLMQEVKATQEFLGKALKEQGEVLRQLLVSYVASTAASLSSASLQHLESEERAPKRFKLMDLLEWSQNTPIRSSDSSAVQACDTVGSIVDIDHIQASGLSWDSDESNSTRKLYIRQTSVDIWNRLNIDKDTNRERHINLRGSPGRGTSSLVWAWCLWWADNNPSRRLRWIHFGKKSAPIRVVDFSNGTFRTATLSERDYSNFSDEDDAALYSDPALSHVVVDGVHAGVGLGPVFVSARKPPAARFILVASWQVYVPKELRFCFSYITMRAWSLNDYISACNNEDFYNSIVQNLDAIEEERKSYEIIATTTTTSNSKSSGPSNVQVTKEERIKAKYYYAGTSARWMFDFSTSEVIREVDELCDGNFDTHEGADRRIFFRDNGSETSIVSHFIGMRLVLNWTSTWFNKMRGVTLPTMVDSQAFKGWLFEFDFKIALRFAWEHVEGPFVEYSLKVFTETNSHELWSVREVTHFQKLSNIESGLPENTWIFPIMYNQPCYDALQLINFRKTSVLAVPRVTLRVVQIARADRRVFNFKYVAQLVSALTNLKGYNIEKVEVVILVSKDKLEDPPAIDPVDESAVPLWDKVLNVRGFDPHHPY